MILRCKPAIRDKLNESLNNCFNQIKKCYVKDHHHIIYLLSDLEEIERYLKPLPLSSDRHQVDLANNFLQKIKFKH